MKKLVCMTWWGDLEIWEEHGIGWWYVTKVIGKRHLWESCPNSPAECDLEILGEL